MNRRGLAIALGLTIILVVGCMITRPQGTETTEDAPIENETTLEPVALEPTPRKAAPAAQAPAEPELAVRTEFKKMVEDTLAQLPTDSDVEKDLKENPHAPAPAMFDFSEKLSDVRDRINTNPELASEAAHFYDACARKSEALIAVQALCLRNLLDLRDRLPKGRLNVDMNTYSPDVKRLTKDLLPIPFRF